MASERKDVAKKFIIYRYERDRTRGDRRKQEGRIISDQEVKSQLAGSHPYREWLDRTQLILEDLKPVEPRALRRDVSLLDRQQAFGYTSEDTKILMSPMATTGQEAVVQGAQEPAVVRSDQVDGAAHDDDAHHAPVGQQGPQLVGIEACEPGPQRVVGRPGCLGLEPDEAADGVGHRAGGPLQQHLPGQ